RRRLGETPSLDEYRLRFPDLAEQLALQVKLHQVLELAWPSTNLGQRSDPEEGPARPPRVAIPGYTVVRELGRGGMGVVFLAGQGRLNRPVALKVPPATLAAEDRTRLRTEAEAAARLQHPNIVQVHETGEHDGLPFLVMEYVEGPSLAQKLAQAPLAPR